MKDYLNHAIDEPRAVSEIELRQIVKLLLEHLNLDAVRVPDSESCLRGATRIKLEPSE